MVTLPPNSSTSAAIRFKRYSFAVPTALLTAYCRVSLSFSRVRTPRFKEVSTSPLMSSLMRRIPFGSRLIKSTVFLAAASVNTSFSQFSSTATDIWISGSLVENSWVIFSAISSILWTSCVASSCTISSAALSLGMAFCLFPPDNAAI